MTTTSTPSSPNTHRSLGWLFRHRAALAATVTITLWSSSFVAVRALGAAYSPGALAFGRITVGAIALGAITVRPGWRAPRGKALLVIVTYGAAWFAAYTVLFNAAAHHLDAGTLALVVNLAPLLVAILAGAFLGEGLTLPLLIGIVVATGGIAVISMGTAGSASGPLGPGLILAILAALLYASGVLFQKVALRRTDAKTTTFVGCAAGALALLPYAPSLVVETATAPRGAMVALLYLGLFPTAIAFSTWTYALAESDAGRLSATTLLVPGVVIGMGWLFLGELPSLVAILGGTLCLLGVLITRSRKAGTSFAGPPHLRPRRRASRSTTSETQTGR